MDKNLSLKTNKYLTPYTGELATPGCGASCRKDWKIAWDRNGGLGGASVIDRGDKPPTSMLAFSQLFPPRSCFTR